MDEMMAAGSESPLKQFERRYRSDSERGVHRSLKDYLAAFPEDSERVADSYVAFEAERWEKERSASVETFGNSAPSLEELLIDVIDRELEDSEELIESAGDFGPFRLLRPIGQGGEGVVYEAEDRRAPDRKVALKVLTALKWLQPQEIERFRDSTRLAASRLDHRNICPIHDMGLDVDPPWVAMRYIEGKNLREHTEAESGSGCRDPQDLLRIGKRVAEALHHAHSSNIVHRDVKPANIIVDAEGEPSILDFGLARPIEREEGGRTRTGAILGTLPYMAPELLDDEASGATAQSDVWALGVTLYECLSGVRPFDAPTPHLLMRRIQESEPADPRRTNPAIGRDIQVFLELCLQKDPAHRYATAGDVADELGRLLERRPLQGRPPGILIRMQRWTQRNPRLAAAFAVLSVALMTLAFLYQALEQSRSDLDEETLGSRADLLAKEGATLVPERLREVERFEAWERRSLPLLEGLVGLIEEGSAEGHEVAGYRALSAERRANDVKKSQLDALRRSARDPGWTLWRLAVEQGGDDPTPLLTPQTGLLPLGRDEASGLWEFWIVGTGSRPEWSGEFSAGSCRIDEDSAIVLVLIPGGSFVMGPSEEDSDEGSFAKEYFEEKLSELYESHELTLAPYFLAKFETTRSQWGRLLARTRWQSSAASAGMEPQAPLTWLQCADVARSWNLLLPTEAQWEFAARGGSTHRYGVGNRVADLESVAWFRPRGEEGDLDIQLVGSKAANGFGLHDMLGNAFEWCRDLLIPYAGSETRAEDCLRLPGSTEVERSDYVLEGRKLDFRVMRGGSFNDAELASRVVYRHRAVVIHAPLEAGVRLARAVDP